VWALDADLAAAFDRIDHDRLLEALGSFPARDMIRDWLKAGVFEAGKGFAPTEEGTPQGGVISPLLLNVALHGLEDAAGVRYRTSGTHAGETEPGSPVVVRYADDLVALCHSKEQAHQVQAQLAEWLAPRGLTFNQEKTTVVSLDTGFDFLGFKVRRLPVSPFPRKVGLVGVEGVLDSPPYPRSRPVLRSGGGVRGRVAIAERRPRRGRP
jgi:RNA-directed DNA polymerase